MVAQDLVERVAAELPQGFSATTPDAGRAVTSVRSLNDTVSSFVSTSTVRRTGRFSVDSGFIATRATSKLPVVIPPSMPPARLDPRS